MKTYIFLFILLSICSPRGLAAAAESQPPMHDLLESLFLHTDYFVEFVNTHPYSIAIREWQRVQELAPNPAAQALLDEHKTTLPAQLYTYKRVKRGEITAQNVEYFAEDTLLSIAKFHHPEALYLLANELYYNSSGMRAVLRRCPYLDDERLLGLVEEIIVTIQQTISAKDLEWQVVREEYDHPEWFYPFYLWFASARLGYRPAYEKLTSLFTRDFFNKKHLFNWSLPTCYYLKTLRLLTILLGSVLGRKLWGLAANIVSEVVAHWNEKAALYELIQRLGVTLFDGPNEVPQALASHVHTELEAFLSNYCFVSCLPCTTITRKQHHLLVAVEKLQEAATSFMTE